MDHPASTHHQATGWQRWIAIVIASLTPAVLTAGHGLARGELVSIPALCFSFLGMLLALATFTSVFEISQARRLGQTSSVVIVAGVAFVIALVERTAGGALQLASGMELGQLGGYRSCGWAIGAAAFDGLLALGLWAVAVVFPFAVRDANLRAIEAERLRTVAELTRLRAHLQPHFLLNTLNTVSGLISAAPDEARRLIGALGDLLRDALEDSAEMQTVHDEIGWLCRYAEILETRHRGALEFRWNIAEDTRQIRVPKLLLQPLLENAVTHGALRRRGGGQVEVTTSIDQHRRLRCVVEDNGPGPGLRKPRPGARGIELVHRRLAIRYAGAAVFRLEASDGRTRSIVELPAEPLP